MTRNSHFLPGIDTLLAGRPGLLRNRRVGLVSHSAALDSSGRTSAEALHARLARRLTCLLAPEHGFLGSAGAGAHCPHARHPDWQIPIHSLYGPTRKPTPEMLANIDTLIFDLQDIAVRCYTYVSTLRLVIEAATESGKELIVTDRPVPLPHTVDGPLAQTDCMSFVGAIPAPLCYGMTPGETARWLVHTLQLDCELTVVPLQNYHGQPFAHTRGWPPWTPPSPGLRTWESALCYPATVFCEAITSLDCGRASPLAFQLLGAPWLDSRLTASALNDLRLPGIAFHPHPFIPAPCPAAQPTGQAAPSAKPASHRPDQPIGGIRLTVLDPAKFRPALTAVAILHTLQTLYGPRRLWRNARNDWFDKLFCTPHLRPALRAGQPYPAIARTWRRELQTFANSRAPFLLYPRKGAPSC